MHYTILYDNTGIIFNNKIIMTWINLKFNVVFIVCVFNYFVLVDVLLL